MVKTFLNLVESIYFKLLRQSFITFNKSARNAGMMEISYGCVGRTRRIGMYPNKNLFVYMRLCEFVQNIVSIEKKIYQ